MGNPVLVSVDSDTKLPPESVIGALGGRFTKKRAAVIYIEDYFAANRVVGTTDDTTALRNALTDAAGRTLVIGSNTLRITQVVNITSQVTVDARGATINLIDDGTATGVSLTVTGVTGFMWTGGTLSQTAATRSGVYGLMNLNQCVNATVDATATVGGSSTGIFVAGGNAITIRNAKVSGCKADGIHISRGSYDVQIVSPFITATGDDGIGVVSVTTEPTNSSITYPQIKRVVISNPIINNLTVVGGGISFVGCADCTVTGGVLSNIKTGGIKISNDVPAGAPTRPSNIVITGTISRNNQNGFVLGSSDDCQLVGVQAISNSDAGFVFSDATRALVSGGKSRGNAGFGVYEASGSGNYVIGADLRGNTLAPSQLQSATLTSCITA